MVGKRRDRLHACRRGEEQEEAEPSESDKWEAVLSGKEKDDKFVMECFHGMCKPYWLRVLCDTERDFYDEFFRQPDTRDSAENVDADGDSATTAPEGNILGEAKTIAARVLRRIFHAHICMVQISNTLSESEVDKVGLTTLVACFRPCGRKRISTTSRGRASTYSCTST